MKDQFIRSLRQASTEAEQRLWSTLRSRRLGGFKFRRQHAIGPYIADFACTEHALIVEADGGQHSESAADAERTKRLENEGWRILRFWNHEILNNTEGVLATILAALRT